MTRFTLVILVSLWSFQTLAQIKYKGNPFVHYFDTEKQNTHAENQSIVQDRRGVIYIANKSGVLEYDGTFWELIKIKGGRSVESLAVNTENTIYVGLSGDFGYLEADSLGELRFQSLLEKIPPKHQNFKNVQSILIGKEEVYFQTNKKIFIFNNDNIKVITSKDAFDQAFYINDTFYVREWGKGLYKLEANSLKIIPESEIYAFDRIKAMLPYQGEESVLILSKNQGGMLFYTQKNSTNRFIPSTFSKQVNDFLINNLVSCGAKLGNYFLIGTNQQGLIAIDEKGQVIQHINQHKGLKTNNIQDIFVDINGKTWLAMDKGVAQIEFNSSFYKYSENNGLKGNIINAIVHKGKIYIGTSQGVFWKTWKDYENPLSGETDFQLVEGSAGYAQKVYKIQNDLFYGHSEGLLLIKNTKAQKILNNEPSLSLITFKKNPSLILVARVNGGLSILEKKAQKWYFKHNIEGVDNYCNDLQEDKFGQIWFSDYGKGVYKLKLSSDFKKVNYKKFYDYKKGLPKLSRTSIKKFGKDILFLTSRGIYTYNKKNDKFRLSQKYNKRLLKPTYAEGIIQDTEKNTWFLQYGQIAYYDMKKGKIINKPDFKKIKNSVLTYISEADDKTILLLSNKALFVYHKQSKTTYQNDFNCLIRNVWLTEDNGQEKLIYGGKRYLFEEDELKITYDNNNLKFFFSATWHENSKETEYSFFLEGTDKQWSVWSKNNNKAYTNLREGKYTFKVKARNIYGKESEIGTYQFTILPPWYRTPIAYFSYIVLGIVAIALIVRLNTYRLRQRNLYLERRIEAGLEEIKSKNQTLAQQNQQLNELNQEKNHLIGIVAHDLRNPLHNILGMANVILLNGENLSEKQEKYTKNIVQTTERLNGMINQILDTQAIDAQSLNLKLEKVNLIKILERVVNNFKHKAKSKNIRINFKPEKTEHFASIDKNYTLQIFENLVSNALKFSYQNSNIYIKIIEQNEFLQIQIIDEGQGIPKTELPKLFQKFQKLSSKPTANENSTGLGLSIVKKYVEAMQGKVWCESEIDKGTTFFVNFPIHKSQNNF